MDNALQASHHNEWDVLKKEYTLLEAPKGRAFSLKMAGSLRSHSQIEIKLTQAVSGCNGNWRYASVRS